MKCYLAAAWSRRSEIERVAFRLGAVGVVVTSNWLFEESELHVTYTDKMFLRERAYIDLADIDRCDVFVRFTDDTNASQAHLAQLLSAARMVEFGYAKAKGKSLYVVGGIQNLFDFMDGITHVKNADELIEALRGK